MVGHIAPEAAVGGPLALVRDGDRIRIDGDARTLECRVDDAELARRRAALGRAPPSGWPACSRNTRKLVGPAHLGAVTHSGAVEWPHEAAPGLLPDPARP